MADVTSILWPKSLLIRAARVLELAQARRLTLTTAESCTGGLLAALLTEIPGSSASFERGFITYSNQAKTDLLGVPPALLTEFGAVSAPVASAMAEGARTQAKADVALAITGVAGPGGGSVEKPVGLVWLACSSALGDLAPGDHAPTLVELRCGNRSRAAIRTASCAAAVDLLLRTLGG